MLEWLFKPHEPDYMIKDIAYSTTNDNESYLFLTVAPEHQAEAMSLLNAYRHIHHRKLLKKTENQAYLSPEKQNQLPDTYIVEAGSTKKSIKITGTEIGIRAALERITSGLCNPNKLDLYALPKSSSYNVK